jgi:D-tyrosyl-tRNA(Tyr) deacylase
VRAVVARVTSASVAVRGVEVGAIGTGLLVLVGVRHTDDVAVAERMASKLYELRVLRDEQSCATSGAALLIVSQFTLYGRTAKGRRPSWGDAAPGPVAEPLIDALVARLTLLGATVATGAFGEDMAVTSVNDGPFTVLVDL